MVGAGKETKHSVLTEGETWLSRTGGIGGLSGSDIVLSGPTEGEDWDKQYQQVATHSHCCTHEENKYSTSVGQGHKNTLKKPLTSAH